MLPPRFPSSFLRAAPVEGKEGHKGRGRSLCPLGTALPQHRAAQPGEPRPGRAPGGPRRGKSPDLTHTHPGTAPGSPQPLLTGPRTDPSIPGPSRCSLPPHPGCSRSRACVPPLPSRGRTRASPSRQRAQLSPSPLTLGRLRPPRLTGPALPARPGHRNAEPQRHRSPPPESTTRWRLPRGRSPALAVIATAPSKARPAALRANPHPNPAPQGTF